MTIDLNNVCSQEHSEEFILFRKSLVQSKNCLTNILRTDGVNSDALNELLDFLDKLFKKCIAELNDVEKREIPKCNKIIFFINQLNNYEKSFNQVIDYLKCTHYASRILNPWKRSLSETIKKLHENLDSSLNLIITVGEELSIDPSLITEQQIDNFIKEQRNQALKELSHQTNKSTSKRTKKKNKEINRKEKQIQTKKEDVKKESSSTKIAKLDPKIQIIQDIYNTHSDLMKLNRVTRWKEKNLLVLRRFVDKKITGEIFEKYKNKTDEELIIQRAYHYLPGLDKILSSKYKKIYTTPTKQGVRMHALLNYKNQEFRGFIDFGIDNNVIYHRYFEPYKKITDLFSSNSFVNVREEKKDDNLEWIQISPTNFEMLSKGELKVTFEGENHFVIIFPIMRDLLNNVLSK